MEKIPPLKKGDQGGFEFDFSCCNRVDFLNELLRHHTSPDFSRCGKSEGQQVQIDENRNELEHCAPWRSNSLGKLKSDHGEMAPLIW
jgi:hypothetical protein